MSFWTAIANIVALCLRLFFDVTQKREQQASDPVNQVEDLQSAIQEARRTGDPSIVQNYFRRAELERDLRAVDDQRRL